jgi:hypothetical protein
MNLEKQLSMNNTKNTKNPIELNLYETLIGFDRRIPCHHGPSARKPLSLLRPACYNRVHLNHRAHPCGFCFTLPNKQDTHVNDIMYPPASPVRYQEA